MSLATVQARQVHRDEVSGGATLFGVQHLLDRALWLVAAAGVSLYDSYG